MEILYINLKWEQGCAEGRVSREHAQSRFFFLFFLIIMLVLISFIGRFTVMSGA